jgi:hypothetical protein
MPNPAGKLKRADMAWALRAAKQRGNDDGSGSRRAGRSGSSAA